MCDICGRMLCPPSCPSYDGRDSERGMSLGRCAECGAYLYEDSDFFIDRQKLFCKPCRESAKTPLTDRMPVFRFRYRKEKNGRGDG